MQETPAWSPGGRASGGGTTKPKRVAVPSSGGRGAEPRQRGDVVTPVCAVRWGRARGERGGVGPAERGTETCTPVLELSRGRT